MANYKSHLSTGATIGAITSFLIDLAAQNKKIQNGEQFQIDWNRCLGTALIGTGLGAIGGVLPDILEPASHPHHRKLFHSITTASAIGYGLYKAHNSTLDSDMKQTINCAAAGYFSHLLLDLDTPKGLPLL
jgi:membrane-bound metal-dependent hydrolase YbcI (DUF457 family)